MKPAHRYRNSGREERDHGQEVEVAIADPVREGHAERLTERPLTLGEVSRQSVGPKGQPQPLNLSDVRSLSAAFSQDRGSLVPVYRKDRDLAVSWKRNLEIAVSQGSVLAATAAELDALFQEFIAAYKVAIATFAKVSVGAAEIEAQFRAYGRLIEALTFKAKGDRNRELMLKPLLSLGVVPVYGAAPAAIVAPWNPLRMQAMASKAERMAGLIRHLLKAPNVLFGDASLYFKEMRDELEHPYFPEIALGWRERKAELLSITDSWMDYSLHELPLVDDAVGADTNENPAQSANQIVDMIQRYLALFPHEQANLSAVLYNCDAASLPQAVVNRINELHEDDNDMRCEVILRHRERTKLHQLYESILESADDDTDGVVSSEASRDFMARLRIGIMADEAPIPDPKDGPRTDLVFLHDVIARHAKIEWYREDSTPVDLEYLVPSRWSRRRPSTIAVIGATASISPISGPLMAATRGSTARYAIFVISSIPGKESSRRLRAATASLLKIVNRVTPRSAVWLLRRICAAALTPKRSNPSMAI